MSSQNSQLRYTLGTTMFGPTACLVMMLALLLTSLPLQACAQTSQASPIVYRGSNYIRLSALPQTGGYHSTFSPLYYNRTETMEALSLMSSNRYNLVRVFLDHGDCVRNDSVAGKDTSDVLGEAYLDNVADFIKIANSVNVQVMVTFEGLPCNQYFNQQLLPLDLNIKGANMQYLHSPAVKAKADYIRQFSRELSARLAPSDLTNLAIYSLENEAYYEGDVLPFLTPSAVELVKTADGLVYNMTDTASRQQCADANALNWFNTIQAIATTELPHILVTVGLFTFAAVGKTGPNGLRPEGPDPRFPFRPASLSKYSNAAFLDVHIYPLGEGYSFQADLASEEWHLVDFTRTPILMGEFGAFKQFYPELPNAATVLKELQIASCPQNFTKGWLLWTWDTDHPNEQPELWSMVDGNGTINAVLSPIQRPDPCVSSSTSLRNQSSIM